MRVATSSSFESEISRALEVLPYVLVEMRAPSCEACKKLDPVLEALEEVYRDKVAFVKVDVAAHAAVADAYGVNFVPRLLVFSRDHTDPQTIRQPYTSDLLNACLGGLPVEECGGADEEEEV